MSLSNYHSTNTGLTAKSNALPLMEILSGTDNRSFGLMDIISMSSHQRKKKKARQKKKKRQINRVFFFVVDALRLDLVRHHEDVSSRKASTFNRFANLHELLMNNSSHCMLYAFRFV